MSDAPLDDIAGTGTTAPLEIQSPWGEFWRRFLRQRVAMVAGGLILLVVLAAIAAPWIAPYDPAEPDYNNILAGPSALHWAGTDAYGRDIFSRILWGAQISLSVGFLSVMLGGVLGVALGLVSGFFGGWVDSLVMRL